LRLDARRAGTAVPHLSAAMGLRKLPHWQTVRSKLIGKVRIAA
jgi:hypothetical protein